MTLLLLICLGQIVDEGFDRPDALQAWERIDGATSGRGPESVASIDDGALLLTVRPGDGRFTAMTRRVPVGDAAWLRISFRMRTDGVDPSAARFVNSNAFLRFDDGPLDGTRTILGTTGWTTLARRLPVPEGARELLLGLFLSCPGKAWFDDVKIEASEAPDWQTEETKHYLYRWLPGDDIPRDARKYNDESYRMVAEFFGVKKPVKVTYHKYPDVATKEELTGRPGNAYRDGDSIHTIWRTDRHEIVHVLCGGWGDPPALLGEGIAVYLSGSWQGEPVKVAAAKVLEEGNYIPLADILDTQAFRRHSDLHTYALSGAFCEWIVEQGGKKLLRELYGALRAGAGAEANAAAIEKVTGRSVGEIDEAFRKSLRR